MIHLKPIPELLAPAGDMEAFCAALAFGADAIYLAETSYGMRSAPKNFTFPQIVQAVTAAHEKGKKVYLVCNILPTNEEAERLPQWLAQANETGADGLIIADLGVLKMAKKYAPSLPRHISTQMGVTNFAAATALYEMGASRVVLARELSLEQIRTLRQKVPAELELEVFCHGAMCVSFSGRCLLSAYLTGRDANRGACAQPCRWGYRVGQITPLNLKEDAPPAHPFSLEEGEDGSFLLNSYDLRTIEYLDQLRDAGVASLKIEGRAKSVSYTASVTAAYRAALDALRDAPDGEYQCPQWALEETEQVSHRPYGTGFLFGEPAQNTEYGGYIRGSNILAVVEKWENGRAECVMKNRLGEGTAVEVLVPGAPPFPLTVTGLTDSEGQPRQEIILPMEHFLIDAPRPLPPGSILRQIRQPH
ncbi:MAG: U32 family peptidase [Ruminococcaceae bacterium]|nr:U32 family peptidase [Oscillospiraceae bacterium]